MSQIRSKAVQTGSRLTQQWMKGRKIENVLVSSPPRNERSLSPPAGQPQHHDSTSPEKNRTGGHSTAAHYSDSPEKNKIQGHSTAAHCSASRPEKNKIQGHSTAAPHYSASPQKNKNRTPTQGPPGNHEKKSTSMRTRAGAGQQQHVAASASSALPRAASKKRDHDFSAGTKSTPNITPGCSSSSSSSKVQRQPSRSRSTSKTPPGSLSPSRPRLRFQLPEPTGHPLLGIAQNQGVRYDPTTSSVSTTTKTKSNEREDHASCPPSRNTRTAKISRNTTSTSAGGYNDMNINCPPAPSRSSTATPFLRMAMIDDIEQLSPSSMSRDVSLQGPSVYRPLDLRRKDADGGGPLDADSPGDASREIRRIGKTKGEEKVKARKKYTDFPCSVVKEVSR